jgi:peptidoglycan/LPS O-acetylase OafA/YrhL
VGFAGPAFSLRSNFKQLIQPPAQHISVVDGIRAISILLVVLGHGFTYYLVQSPLPIAEKLRYFERPYVPLLHAADLGVDAFFVISGFLIAGLLFRERDEAGDINVGRFYLRRALRLLPAYYVAMVIYEGHAYLGGACGDEHCSSIWANLLYVNNLLPGATQAMKFTWSLAIEEQFYWVFPLFVLALWRLQRHRGAALVALLAAAVAIRLFLARAWNIHTPLEIKPMGDQFDFSEINVEWDVLYVKPWARFGSLVAGVLVSYVLHVRRQVKAARPGWGSTLLLISGCCLIASAMVIPRFAVHPATHPIAKWLLGPFNWVVAGTQHYVFSVGVALALLALTASNGFVLFRRFLSLRFFYVIAQLSYAAYLLNLEIILPLAGRLNEPSLRLTHAIGFTAVCALLVFLASMAMYLLVERPFMNLRAPIERLMSRPPVEAVLSAGIDTAAHGKAR